MAVLRFEHFQLDTAQAALRCRGEIVTLAPQVLDLLIALIERPGELVSRAELQDRLWPDTHTDRERGLNNAINRLRETLGDSAANPRFIETVPKRGYRFIAPLEPPQPVVPRKWIAAGAAAAVLLATWFLLPQRRQDAPEAYWTAVRLIRRGEAGDLDAARISLQAAIRKNPGFAPAYAEMAPLVLDLVDMGRVSASAGREEAAAAARQARHLHPSLAAAHLAMAAVHLRAEWNLDAAEREVEQALWLDPKSAEAWRTRATIDLARGRPAHAVQAADRSVALDPSSAWSRTASGRALFYSRDTGRSAMELESAVLANPQFGPAHHYLTEVYWNAGRRDDARREFLNSLRLSGVAPSDLARIPSLPEYWRAHLDELSGQPQRQGVPYKLATWLLQLGQNTRAIEWLSRALAQKDVRLLFLRVNPAFDRLREDRDFQNLLARIPK